MRLHLKCWVYADPARLSAYHTALARYIRANCGQNRWVVTDVLDKGHARPDAARRFLAIETLVSIDMSSCNGRTDEDELYEQVVKIVKSAILDRSSFNKAVGLPTSEPTVFWSLLEVGKTHGSRFSRFMVPHPRKSDQMPAEGLAEVLNRLSEKQLDDEDHTHEKCPKWGALGCFEYQLNEHRILFKHLEECIDLLTKDKGVEVVAGPVNAHTLEMVETLGELYTNFGGLASLLDSVATLPPAQKPRKSALRRLLRLIMLIATLRRRQEKEEKKQKEQRAEQAFRDLKRRVPLDLASIRQRMYGPITHARLRNASNLDKLRLACERAAPGAERFAITDHHAINPNNLNDDAARAREFKHVTKWFIKEHTRMLEDFEALIKTSGLNDPSRMVPFAGCRAAAVEQASTVDGYDSELELWNEKS